MQSGEPVESGYAAAEHGALRLPLSPHCMLIPKGLRRNNQSLTGAGQGSAAECHVPGRINRPG